MIRPLIAALGVAALIGGPAPGAARTTGHDHLSFFPGYLYLLPPAIQIQPARGVDFVALTNSR